MRSNWLNRIDPPRNGPSPEWGSKSKACRAFGALLTMIIRSDWLLGSRVDCARATQLTCDPAVRPFARVELAQDPI